MNILKTQNLTKSYSGRRVVDDVSISIEKGDVFGLIGQNGAGKTTFMRLVTSLTNPNSGQIHLFGETEPKKIFKARSRIGCIIEQPVLYSNLNAVQNLEFYRILKGISNKNRVVECLNMVDLTDTGETKFKDFSLGMKHRLGFALAILSQPDFLILDEPANGLDPTNIVAMRNIIKRLSKEGVTILLSSHILTELALMSNKYAIIHHGRVLKSFSQEQLHEECRQAISVTIDNTSKAAETLKTALNIIDCKLISENELRIYGYKGDPGEITLQLVKAGVRVMSIKEVGDSLEDYYTKIIVGAFA